jgi:phosphoribosylglycinamide formyltransferase 1
MKKNIAIFASGGGSNAERIMAHFEDNEVAQVALVVCNKSNAGVLAIAKRYNVPTLLIDRAFFYESEHILKMMAARGIDFIALAGFLWLIPSYLVKAFPNKIVNIHPALLPKYGGKGMYGHHVHVAVKAAGESESGMTIHYVNEHYDEGNIIFQTTCPISETDTATDIAHKVLTLEHTFFATTIEKVLKL